MNQCHRGSVSAFLHAIFNRWSSDPSIQMFTQILHVHTHTHICLNSHLHTYMSVYIHRHNPIHVHTQRHAHMNTHTHAHICTHTHTHARTHALTHIYAWAHAPYMHKTHSKKKPIIQEMSVYRSDMDRVEEVRTMVPLRNQRRHDLYKVVDLSDTHLNQENKEKE